MRWWHIEALLPIEANVFGSERWSASMFWNELANDDNFYLVAVDTDAAPRGLTPDAVVPRDAHAAAAASRRRSPGRLHRPRCGR